MSVFVFHCNYGHILYRFRDTARYWTKIACIKVTVSDSRSAAITDLIVTRAVSAIAELLVCIQAGDIIVIDDECRQTAARRRGSRLWQNVESLYRVFS